MDQRIDQLKKDSGYEWNEPETMNQVFLQEWLGDKAEAQLATKLDRRLDAIGRAVSAMEKTGYVRPTRLSGEKLELG